MANYEIDKALSIEWGKLAGDMPVSLSDRQREDDHARTLPFRGRCQTCNVILTWANHSSRYNHACLECELSEARDE